MTNENNSDTELLLTFFSVFGRFEQALKKAGFVKAGRRAGADWDRFALQIEKNFDPDVAPELQGAVAYMLGVPEERKPRRKIPGFLSDILLLANLIQEAGNNLSRNMNFERHTETDDEIMMACMVILDAWSHLEPEVDRILNGAK
jgi:hypothetical protein